jgi:hypothetical protein
MTKRTLSGVAMAMLFLLPSCGTVNSVRWAYGKSSVFGEPDSFSEKNALRAVVGAPVIVAGVAYDAVTWPIQLIFGVWPMWGSSSTMMKPDDV